MNLFRSDLHPRRRRRSIGKYITHYRAMLFYLPELLSATSGRLNEGAEEKNLCEKESGPLVLRKVY